MTVLQMFSLCGKTAVVTGGAGLYGRQITEALAEAGATVVVASRDLPALTRYAETCRERGLAVHPAAFDQGEEADAARLRDTVLELTGRIDVLVNNAVARTLKGGWEGDAADFDRSMHINATGLFTVTRTIGDVLYRQGAGSIINIGSMMGMVGVEMANYRGTDMGGFAPDYYFHKGGMINFTRLCASYFGRRNVRVNCVSPGGLQQPTHPEPFVRQYSERTQLGRMANDTDLKGVIVFLASDASAYITGMNIPVDGGYTAK